jgi:hypothetical protein
MVSASGLATLLVTATGMEMGMQMGTGTETAMRLAMGLGRARPKERATLSPPPSLERPPSRRTSRLEHAG